MAFDTPDRPRLTVFAGPNGAGKSTAYRRFVEAGYDAGAYLNPDDAASDIGLATGTSAGVALRAGRQVIERTRSLIAARQPFSRETTLSGGEIMRSIAAAGGAGYRVVMVFVGVRSTSTVKSRVAFRVASGRHDVPLATQDRRFRRSLNNAPHAARIADVAYFLDNAGLRHKLVATAYQGTVRFLDARGADWVARATAGLPLAPVTQFRDDALAQLRRAEGMAETLQVREPQTSYPTNAECRS